MANYHLKYVHPANPARPHKPQIDFLSLPVIGGRVSKIHFVSGRAGGKTAAAVMLVMQTVIREPNTVGLVLAPTYKALQRSWLREFRRVVPKQIYKYVKSDERIDFINGAVVYLSSLYIDNPAKGLDASRGLEVNWMLIDEAAWGFSMEQYTNLMACIRAPGDARFMACTTTPRLNDYRALVESEGHTAIYSTSHDNPWLPDGWVSDVAQQMSTQQAEREIMGKWVSLDGLVWDSWSNEQWPKGNIYDYRFQPHRPWYLFLDLGSATAAFIVMQLVDVDHLGYNMPGSHIWVACAEHLPSHDGSASRAFQILRDRYGTPAMVIAGADMGTRASTDGRTAAYFVREVFGGIPVKAVGNWMADKEIQYNRMTYLIKDRYDVRRFCVSSHMESTGHMSKRAKRGIRELMQQDTWPDGAGKQRCDFLAKEGRLEHIRDALLYGAVGIMSPPRMAPNGLAG